MLVGQRNNGQRTSKPHLRIYLAASQVSTDVITRELCKACLSPLSLFLSRNTIYVFSFGIMFFSINRYEFKTFLKSFRSWLETEEYFTRRGQFSIFIFNVQFSSYRELTFRETLKKVNFCTLFLYIIFFTKPIETCNFSVSDRTETF